MAAPVLDTSSFFAALQKAGLVSDTDLEKARRTCEGLSDPSAIGRKLVHVSLLSPWQANQILRGREDYSLQNYSLLDQIAIDDFGETFVAVRDGMQHAARIRTFSSAQPLSSEDSSVFVEEAQRVAALDHPHVAHVCDVGQVDGRYFLVTEDPAGRDLASAITPQNTLAPAAAAEIIRDVAMGLDYAHQHDVVHGNLTPKQLLQNGDGVKIVDFALPQLARASQMPDGVLLDADYMAPELAAGGTAIDARCDIYSLGCVFYFLLTGRPPFPNGSRQERLQAQANEEPPAIDSLRPDVPNYLVWVCRMMMAKDPDRRIGSAGEVVEYLVKWIDA